MNPNNEKIIVENPALAMMQHRLGAHTGTLDAFGLVNSITVINERAITLLNMLSNHLDNNGGHSNIEAVQIVLTAIENELLDINAIAGCFWDLQHQQRKQNEPSQQTG